LAGSAGGTRDEEVVVHDHDAFGAVALRHPLLLGVGRVHQHHVRFAARRKGERRAGADADRLDLVAGLLLEQRHQHVQQAAVLRAGGRGQDERPLVGPRRGNRRRFARRTGGRRRRQ
jgi:hypothetical protein